MLWNSGFCLDQLFPSLPEVGAAAREDAAHKSTCQLAAMRVPQGSRSSSHGLPQASGEWKVFGLGGSQSNSGRAGQPGSCGSGPAQSSGAGSR